MAYSNSTPITDTSPRVTSHSVNLTGLTAGTLYHFRVKSKDASGNLQTSGDYTFTTSAGADTTPPTYSAISSGTPGSTTATITWTTNENADSQVEWGTTTSYGNSTPSSPADTSPRVTSHSVPLTGLTAGTLYHFRVKSKDAAGNMTPSADNTFTTAAPPAGVSKANLTSFWTFDNGGGLGVDEMGNNNLTAFNTPTATTGIVGSGATNNGAANTLYCPDNASQVVGSSSLTICGWIKIMGSVVPSTLYGVLSKNATIPGAGSNNSGGIYYNSYSNEWAFSISSDGTAVTNLMIANTVTVGNWYFVVGRFNASSNQIKLNVYSGAGQISGSPATGSFTGPVYHSTYQIEVMAVATAMGHNQVNDELGFWKRYLSDAEVDDLWNGGAGLPFSSFVP